MSSGSYYDDFNDEHYPEDPSNSSEWLMQMFIGIDELRILYSHVCYAIETWPGSPARPAEEQEYLKYLRGKLFSMLCEYQFTEGK